MTGASTILPKIQPPRPNQIEPVPATPVDSIGSPNAISCRESSPCHRFQRRRRRTVILAYS